ncbi:MAG TPA: M20/M25/M40 family metallo-hydrolase [Vicinamibacterales bacterium]
MKFKTLLAGSLLALATALPYSAQGTIDPRINDKIRQEEAANSQIMRTMHFLTDLYGPRLTGSPNHKAAAEWAVKQMTEWGFSNAHLEPWEFGHPGWANEHVEAHIVSPMKSVLVVQPLAWTPGTRGPVTAKAFNLIAPQGPEVPQAEAAAAPGGGRGPQRLGPTQADLTAYLESVRAQVAGAAVLVGRPAFVPVSFQAEATRLSDVDAKCRYAEDPSADPDCQGRGRGGQRGGGGAPPAPSDRLTARQINTQIDDFLVAGKAALRIDDAGRWNGIVTAPNNRTYDETKQTPTLVMRNDDYGRIARILADGTPVTLGFTITNTWYPEGHTSYNTIAEIPGSDKKAEVVMLGGHLDSWHVATGATDNAVGCAVMMEAARILKALGVQPRRTIRVALWSGEEEGLLGSLAYVDQHFGTVESPKPEFATLDAYLNIDSGTGRARGAGVFGPPEAGAILRKALAPFKDLGVAGATTTTSRATGGTDSTSFNHAGLPGIGFGQDSIDYGPHTHHTNLDTYERIIEDDVKTSATVIAAVLYELAMRDEMLPRLPADKMPPLPQERGGGH